VTQWLLYGCTGYSGRLIAGYARDVGLQPILAGRCERTTSALARELDLPYRVFDLTQPATIDANLQDCDLLFNAAGPFTATCLPLLEACLRTQTHHLSLVAEVPMLETLVTYDQQARDAGIVLGVGLGFDVIPTDCLAAVLKDAMPDATDLVIGMDGPNHTSVGSTKELVEQLVDQPFWLRREGKLVVAGAKSQTLRFSSVVAGEPKPATTIAWGDTSSAFHSTGIPNITVYMTTSTVERWLIHNLPRLRPWLLKPWVRKSIDWLIEQLVSGPDDETRDSAVTQLFAEVRNARGEVKRAELTTASAYKLTYLGAVQAVQAMLSGPAREGGYYTPSQLLGARAIEKIPGSSAITLVDLPPGSAL